MDTYISSIILSVLAIRLYSPPIVLQQGLMSEISRITFESGVEK